MSAPLRLWLLGLLLACHPDADSPSVDEPSLLPLDRPRLARRLSLDLRGVLPTTDELDAAEADAEALSALREEWLADPRFAERLVDLYQERWRMELDEYSATAADLGFPDEETYSFQRSVGQEPLRLVARVVAEDRPYVEVVTADWTVANPLLESIYPLDREAGDDWTVARYTDNRPAAGVLSTNGLWWRYSSPLYNYNRRRTAAILDLLICEDLLSRPVVFTEALAAGSEDAATAILTEPTCQGCHATIEPIAATLFGFLAADDYSAIEKTRYHPERETNGPTTLGVSPAWYGEPVEGLGGLGRAIAADGRFLDCAVETVLSGLLRRPVEETDRALLREAREAFVDEDLALKAAIRVITDGESYRAGGLGGGASLTDLDREATRRILVGSQQESLLSELTGLSWTLDGADQQDEDSTGYRILSGSVDGEAVTAPASTPGLTWALWSARVAEVAARVAVDHDLDGERPARLLGELDEQSRPEDPAFQETLAGLHWRLLAIRPTPDTLAALTRLWTAAEAESGSGREAWATVVGVLLRDPEFLSY
jgi:hypothetical protein